MFPRSRLLVLAILISPLVGFAAEAHAHPCLVGRWVYMAPGCGPTVYDFGPGEYQGNGVWKGDVFVTVGGVPIGPGCYDLRLASESMGTIGIRDGKQIGTRVGLIDLENWVMEYMCTTYRRVPE